MNTIEEAAENIINLRSVCRRACKKLLHLRNVPEAKKKNDEAYKYLVKCWALCEEAHDTLENKGFRIDRLEAEATDFYQ